MAVEPLQRQVVRERTVAQLMGRTAAGDRVYPSRVVPYRREQPLPAISVYTLAEVGVPLGNMSAFQFQESLQLTIEAVVERETAEGDTADARLRADVCAPLDALCAEIEQALWPNFTWYDCMISGAERKEWRLDLGAPNETDRRTAAATLAATLNYADIYEPTIVDNFETLWLEFDVIDPAADPNVDGHPTAPPDGYPGGYPGPDGRIELAVRVPKDGTLWPLLRAGARVAGLVRGGTGLRTAPRKEG
jgi:hypothetical protein